MSELWSRLRKASSDKEVKSVLSSRRAKKKKKKKTIIIIFMHKFSGLVTQLGDIVGSR